MIELNKGVAAILSILLVLFLLCGALTAKTIFVPDSYGLIQDAINGSVDGDTIIVRPGTYTENIDYLGKKIVLVSEKGPGVTVIDGYQMGSVVVFRSGEGNDSVLDGFTITNGNGTFIPYHGDHGGGIACEKSSPVIRGNIINGNDAAAAGGGIYCWMSSALIEENTIMDNFGWGAGGIGCIYNSCTVRNNLIHSNDSFYGGGVLCANDSSIIEGNVIYNNNANFSGGAIHAADYSRAVIRNNSMYGNTAETGGACCIMMHAQILMENNIIYKNTARMAGGAVYYSYESRGIIQNCTIVENTAIGITPQMEGGGTVYCVHGSANIMNSILWDNKSQTGAGPEIFLLFGALPSTINIGYCNLKGGLASVYCDPKCTVNWGSGMIDIVPGFADSANGDYHLQVNSPCRDRGVWYSNLPQTDFEGDMRTAGGQPDMGGDEFYYHLYHSGDVVPGNSLGVKVVGVPGMPVKLAFGVGLQDPPQPTYYGNLYLTLPPAAMINLGLIPSDGVLKQNSTVPLNWSSGEEKYFQALVGGIGSPNSVLTNLMVLKVE